MAIYHLLSVTYTGRTTLIFLKECRNVTVVRIHKGRTSAGTLRHCPRCEKSMSQTFSIPSRKSREGPSPLLSPGTVSNSSNKVTLGMEELLTNTKRFLYCSDFPLPKIPILVCFFLYKNVTNLQQKAGTPTILFNGFCATEFLLSQNKKVLRHPASDFSSHSSRCTRVRLLGFLSGGKGEGRRPSGSGRNQLPSE